MSTHRSHRPRLLGSTGLRAVAQFAITGMLAVGLLGLLAVKILERTGRNEAIANAKRETRLAAHGIAEAQLTPALLRGDPAALAAMDRTAARIKAGGTVVRVKVWDSAGRIVYSDDHRLIGSRYGLAPANLQSLRRGSVEAEVSDLSAPENRFERRYGKLLEVYLGVRATDGRRLLYEDYLRFSSVAASGRHLWRSFAPGLIATLVLLELAQIPLAFSLARRLQRGQREREALLRKAIDASELERRRIARDLHDGAVQDLAGVSFSLTAARDQIGRDDATASATVERAAAEVRDSMRSLRTTLVDIYPPTLQRSGLQAALSDVVSTVSAEGVGADLQVDPDLDIPPDTERLLFRAAQESLRNVARHAGATHVRVCAERVDGHARLLVEDDGRGFTPGDSPGADHFGLRMLDDLVRDAGGTIDVESEPGHGTRVRIGVPLR